jgi:hypothetical protein
MSVLPANVAPSQASAPAAVTTPYRFIETARAIENEVGQVIVGQPRVWAKPCSCARSVKRST